MDIDPHSPEWAVAWTLRRALRSLLKPKHEARPDWIAKDVVNDLRQSNWHLIKGRSNAGWDHNPEAIRIRQEQQRNFDNRLKAIKELVRKMSQFPSAKHE